MLKIDFMDIPNRLKAKAGLTVLKLASEVFDAIVDPEKMKNYFISSGSAKMEEGKEIQWSFPEMDMSFPVTIKKLVPNELVSFEWGDPKEGTTTVEIRLSAKGDRTAIRIVEGERELNAAGLEWMQRNTEGWANFLACMKAWLEYGVHLRKGAFEPDQMPDASS